MCGIAAIYGYGDGRPVNRLELSRMSERMSARGPDGTGIWLSEDGRVGLAHRRLAILDLSPRGAQPMQDETGQLILILNGEIYNYRDLRAQLERVGCRFRSHSDTEVLIQLYARRGLRMLESLRGMFAFALWDGRRQALLLARDPYGIKPLYYADDGQTIRAASQVKALLAGGGVATTPDPAGHVGFFLWGHLPDPHTLYKQVHTVPAGCYVWIERGRTLRQESFCSVPAIFAQNSRGEPPAEWDPSASAVRNLVQDSVRHHMIADVPVGVFLSSGIDSTTIAALAAQETPHLHTVTLGFDKYRGTARDETVLAEEVAGLYGTRHQTVYVNRRDFEERLDHLFWSMDQPTIDGVNVYWVSRVARQSGLKVALSGLGGDELFGGYPSFRQIPRLVKSLQPFREWRRLGAGLRTLAAPLLEPFTSPKYAGLIEYGGSYPGAYLLRRGLFMPWELPRLLDPDLVRCGWSELQPLDALGRDIDGLKSPRSVVSCLESCWYMRNQILRDADWAGMAHSLEIRVPLVDVPLLRSLSGAISQDTPPTKKTLAQIPPKPLPRSILNKPKRTFSVPIRDWLLAGSGRAGRERVSPGERGSRAWARQVYLQFTGHEVLQRQNASLN